MKNIGLVGFGISSKALCDYFLMQGDRVYVHNETSVPLPNGAIPVFSRDYLSCNEDIVFRSPGVHPKKIKTKAPILVESDFALSKINIPKLLVTGSDGKTTTSTLIHKMLGDGSFIGGNIGTPLLNAVNMPCKYLVGELSSFQLLNSSPKCNVAVITNITENHLDWHESMNEYVGAKLNLLKNATRVVLPYDDPLLYKEGLKHKNATFFSLGDLSGESFDRVYIKDGFVYHNDRRLFGACEIALPGSYNLLNILASIGATYEFASVEQQALVARAFKGVTGRLEFIKKVGGVSFFNSSIDTTPSRTLATASALDISKTVLIMGGYDKSLSYDILKEPLKNARGVVLFGENKYKILKSLACHTIVVDNLKEALVASLSLAKEGDNILLSPASASFDMFSSYKDRGDRFTKLVQELKE